MPAERCLLVVNFRSAALTREAVRSARASSSSPIHVIVVDNSCSEDELRQLESAGADRVIAARRNLGYAGAINLGVSEASQPVLVISNPDVVYEPGCIDALVSALDEERAGMTGPLLYWDEGGQWLLPPADEGSAASKLDEIIAGRSSPWRRARDRRRTRRRIAFWSLRSPTETRAVSGAVMCIRKPTIQALGGFDERFELYFEEIDFMRRLRRRGERIVYVPAAKCRHLYNQSAGVEGTAPSLYLRSEAEYYRKSCGAWLVGCMHRFGSTPRMEGGFREIAPGEPIERPASAGTYLVEASPLFTFDPAAGSFPAEWPVRMPSEVLEQYRSGDLFLRVVNAETGEAAAAFRMPGQGR